MADDKPVKAKRRVKNPETFREKVVKAAENDGKPKTARRAQGVVGRFTHRLFAPIGRVLRQIGKSKAFKPFKKPLRIVGKILLPPYIRGSWQELKLVTWPNWKQSRDLTIAVIGFAFVFGAIIAVVDYGLDKLFRAILLK